MSLTLPYKQKNYLGEYISDTAAEAYLSANRWTSDGTSSGNVNNGVWYYNTTGNVFRGYLAGSWKTFLMEGIIPIEYSWNIHSAKIEVGSGVSQVKMDDIPAGSYTTDTAYSVLPWFCPRMPTASPKLRMFSTPYQSGGSGSNYRVAIRIRVISPGQNISTIDPTNDQVIVQGVVPNIDRWKCNYHEFTLPINIWAPNSYVDFYVGRDAQGQVTGGAADTYSRRIGIYGVNLIYP